MQHHNTLLYQRAVKNTGNAFSAFKPQFKQPIAKDFDMWFAQVSTKHFHTVSQCKISTAQTLWQSQNINLNGITVVNNGVLHEMNSNKYVTKKAVIILMAANDRQTPLILLDFQF